MSIPTAVPPPVRTAAAFAAAMVAVGAAHAVLLAVTGVSAWFLVHAVPPRLVDAIVPPRMMFGVVWSGLMVVALGGLRYWLDRQDDW